MFFSPSLSILLFLFNSPPNKKNSAYTHVYKERLLLLLASCVMLARLEGIKLPNINYPNNMVLLNHDAAILQKSCGKIWLQAQYWRVKRTSECERGRIKWRKVHTLLFVVSLYYCLFLLK